MNLRWIRYLNVKHKNYKPFKRKRRINFRDLPSGRVLNHDAVSAIHETKILVNWTSA